LIGALPVEPRPHGEELFGTRKAAPRIASPGDLGSGRGTPPEPGSCGGQRLFDEPVAGDAPSFVVETHLVTNSELQLLVAEAEHLGYSPMHGWY